MKIKTTILIILFFLKNFSLFAQKNSIPATDSLLKKLSEITITATKTNQSVIKSPVSIFVLAPSSVRLTPALSYFDALENMQGIQTSTASLGCKVINTRGFANTTNVRFGQLTDGKDIASPHIGAAVGIGLAPNDLDIEKVEILPGMASALYGMNTVNGLANFITKSPFTYTGISLQQKVGAMHFNDKNSCVTPYTETNFRWAQKISNKVAFKINATYIRGKDWIASDYNDLNPKANESSNLIGEDNPGYDAVNSYGNESSNRKTIALGGKNYVVSRTGYIESDLANNTVQNIKSDVGIFYKINEKNMISYSFRIALMDNIYQRANRFRMDNYFLQQHAIEYKGSSVEARIYLNNESTGKTYNLRSMGENIDRDFKKDNLWYADYKTAFNNSFAVGNVVADAHRDARLFADEGRYEPGTEIYNTTLKKLQGINNWDSGAALSVKQSFVQTEVQVNLTKEYLKVLEKLGFDILTGIDNRTYVIQPDGNYFINPKSNNQFKRYSYKKTGGFISVNKRFFKDKLNIGFIVRADKSDYYKLKWNPRISVVYMPIPTQSIRASFQSSYRYPSIFEAFSNVNSGGVKRIGGLPIMSNGVFENAYLQTSISAFQAAVLNDVNKNGLTKNQAIIKQQALLKKNPYTYMKPEQVLAFEFGYRGKFFKSKLFIDADFYFNNYRSFIAQVNMNVPTTNSTDSMPFYLNEKALQKPYRMYTNSNSVINTLGASIGITYNTLNNIIIKGNLNYATIQKTSKQDGFEDGFNTPKWIVNVSLTKENLFKYLEFGVNFKWQSKYYWQSFLVSGAVSAFTNVDAQISCNVPKINTKIRLGANNLLNYYYKSYLGAPSIGGLYYLSITYGLK